MTRARDAGRLVGLRSVLFAALGAGLLCGVAASAAGPQQTAPAPTPAKADAAPKKPDFTLDDEDEDAPAQKAKPAEARPGGGKPSFDIDDETPVKKSSAPRRAFAGIAECVRCHQNQATAYLAGPHGREWDERTPAADIGCERCHGPGMAHDLEPGAKDKIVNFKNTAPREVTKVCLTCHDKRDHADWASGTHAMRNVSCVNCHSVHSAKSERAHLKEPDVVSTCAQCHRDKAAKMVRQNHMPIREGKMDCASCHNEHGSKNVRLLRAGSTVNELCTSCHAEKRGPFLWDHPPARESCVTCHDPHGSSNDRLLVAKAPMLCQRCHISTRHPATPYDGVTLAAAGNRLMGRSCVTCHPMLHGSNHPSGAFFQR